MRPPVVLALLSATACAQAPADYATARRPARIETVSLPGPGGLALRALLALPPQGAARSGTTVVALHGCAGLGPPGAPPRLPVREADWAARLTEEGRAVLFPDSFGSRGLGPACGVRGHPAPPETVRSADAGAAAAWAAAQPWSPPGGVVLLGWSHGASTALAAVGAPGPGSAAIRAAVAFYPGCGALRRQGGWEPAAPVLMLLGGADDWTPPAPCLALAAANAGRVAAEVFPGAPHDFDHPGLLTRTRTLADGRAVTTGSDPAARDAALARVRAFLAAQGGGPP